MKKIYRRKIIFVSYVLLLCNLFAAGKQKTPVWLNSLETEFPKQEYIAQIGQGKTETEAKNDAVSQICLLFEANVESQIQTNITANSGNSSVTNDNSINIKTTVNTNIQLINLKYSDSYCDKQNKIYIVAYLNRREAFDSLKSKIDIPSQKILDYTELAEKENDNLKSALYLQKAMNFSEEFFKQYQFFAVLSPNSLKNYSSAYNTALNLPSKMKKSFSECSFKFFVENDENNQIFGRIQQIFNKSGFVSDQNNGKYTVFVKINMEKQSVSTGYNFYPEFEAVISNNEMVISSFSQKGNKISAKNEDVACKRAYKELEKLLEEAYFSQFLDKN